MTHHSYNRYDLLMILFIASNAFGAIGVPVTVPRILGMLSIPWLIKNLSALRKNCPQYVTIFFIIWFVLSIFSFIWTPDRINGLKFLAYNICSTANFFAIYMFFIKAKNPLKSLTKGWIIFFIATAPVALWEIFSGKHLSISIQDEFTQLSSASGERFKRIFASVTYGNVNTYTLILSYILPFVYFGFLILKRKTIALISILAIAYFIMLNASRGGFFCMCISTFMFFIYVWKEKSVNKLVIAVLIICIGVYIASILDVLLLQLSTRAENTGGLAHDDARMFIYDKVLDIFISYIGLGCGIGGIIPAMQSINSLTITAPHNAMLEFLVQYGVIPFAFFAYMYIRVLITVIKSKVSSIKYLGWTCTLISPFLFIINSMYLADTCFWIFISSLLCISVFSTHHRSQMKGILHGNN